MNFLIFLNKGYGNDSGFMILIILLIILTAAYWIGALVLTILGISKIYSKEELLKNKGKKLLIAGVIMLIIGLGFCGSTFF